MSAENITTNTKIELESTPTKVKDLNDITINSTPTQTVETKESVSKTLDVNTPYYLIIYLL